MNEVIDLKTYTRAFSQDILACYILPYLLQEKRGGLKKGRKVKQLYLKRVRPLLTHQHANPPPKPYVNHHVSPEINSNKRLSHDPPSMPPILVDGGGSDAPVWSTVPSTVQQKTCPG
jgi:hypothetical protein